jgi:hypothetical protein
VNRLFSISLTPMLGCTDEPTWETDDDEVPTEPRDPDQLPGGDTPPGDDPCDDDISCRWYPRGVDTDTPFADDDLDAALLTEDGAVTLDDTALEQFVAWIPNTDEGTISLFDTVTRDELGRFRTDSGSDPRPSRTSVRHDGGVYVANRAGQSVTHISLAANCPSSVEGAPPTTSSGPDDLLEWGDDDCLIWRTDLSGHGPVTAVAAGEDDGKQILWVGAGDDTLGKVEGDTGRVLFRTESPVRPHGFALDDEGQLWIADLVGAQLGRVDTTECRNHESCEVEICGDAGLHCAKQRIAAPGRVDGIAVDHEQYVWLGGDLSRFDRNASLGQRWLHLVPEHRLFGLAVDDEGRLYGAARNQGLYRFDREEPQFSTYISGTRNRSVSAVDVDHHGYAWAINVEDNTAFVIDPGPGLYDGSVDALVAGLDGPDAYSDMMGAAVTYPVHQRGSLRLRFENCDPVRHSLTEWQTLRFRADLPGGTKIAWRVRGASQESHLGSAHWLYGGTSPEDESPIDLRAVLATDELQEARHIEVEAQLRPSLEDGEFFVPRLHVVDVVSKCGEVVL